MPSHNCANLMLNSMLFVFRLFSIATCCLSIVYLDEHPEELTEVQIMREECQRCTAVVWKHSASESRHQEADLEGERKKKQCYWVFFFSFKLTGDVLPQKQNHFLNKPETSVTSLLRFMQAAAGPRWIFSTGLKPLPHLSRWEASYSTDLLHHHAANCIRGWWQHK